MSTSTGPAGPGPLNLEAVKLTDVGRLRPHNEDFLDYHVPSDPEQLKRKGAIYLVADGMGGHQAGEVASQDAVEVVIRQYYKDSSDDVSTSLVRAFRAANKHIYERARADPSKAGMGTTLVAAVILGRTVYIGNVGDSRAYLVGPAGIAQITNDHSWVEAQVKAGLLTPEQARRHPQRNLVTRALGSKSSVEVDLFRGRLGKGDLLLLCTDGLTGHVDNLEIEEALREHPPQEAAELLVAEANEHGGTDNISLMIIDGRKEMAQVPAVDEERPRALPLIPLLAGAALLLALLAAALLLLPGLLKLEPAPTDSLTITPESAPQSANTAIVPGTVAPAVPAAPTETAAPPTTVTVPAPTQTPLPVAASPTPTPGPPVVAGPTPFPAPALSKPDANADLRNKVRFTWQWTHPLLPDDHFFDLRIRSQVEKNAGLESRSAITPTKATEAEVNLDLVPAIQNDGRGIYYWTVVVVRDAQNPEVVGQQGEERKFRYLEP